MKSLLFISIMAITVVGCSPQIRVFTDHDPEYDLSAYSTFDWGLKANVEEGKNPLLYNELNDKRIKLAVQEHLAAHGYRLTCDGPDLLLHYHIVLDDQSVVTTEPLGYRYGAYWTRMQTNVYSYREGTLILDLMDTKTNHLVWRGWAVTAIDHVNPEKVEPFIQTAVERIFKKFPALDRKSAPGKSLHQNNLP